MRLSDVTGFGTLLSAGVLLVSCGAPQQVAVPAQGAPPVQAPASSTLRHGGHGISWMARGVKQRDLLYVSNANGTVSVYRYWQHTLVGVLTNFIEPLGECSDWAGDVYITDRQTKDTSEYAHGGKKPIRILRERGERPMGCSVDPKTGDLAVANNPGRYNYKPGNITIFKNGQSNPVIYNGPNNDDFTSCAYDNRGNLFTTSQEDYYDRSTHFYYLPKGGTRLLPMDLQAPGEEGSSGWDYVQGLAWDGKYWVVESDNVLFRFTIDITAQYVDSTKLAGVAGVAQSFSLYRTGPRSPATEIVAGTGGSNTGAVEYWNYPSGGDPIGNITKDLSAPFGTAISLRVK